MKSFGGNPVVQNACGFKSLLVHDDERMTQEREKVICIVLIL